MRSMRKQSGHGGNGCTAESRLKGRKVAYKDRWDDHEIKSYMPILRSTPCAKRLKELAASIQRKVRSNYDSDR